MAAPTIPRGGRPKGARNVERIPLLPPGPPTPLHAKLAREFALTGLKDTQIAERFGIATATLYEWRRTDDAFRFALAEGELVADAPLLAEIERLARGDYLVKSKTVITKREDGSKQIDCERDGDPNASVLLHVFKIRHPQLFAAAKGEADATDANDQQALRAHETRLMELASRYGNG
jgi:transposase-like protein